MGSHPINLAFRLLLEVTMYIGLGMWGWTYGEGLIRYFLAILVPILAAVLWGVFAVPGDPSRSGKAPVPIPGVLRLILELVLFAFSAWGWFSSGYEMLGLALIILVFIHYALSYDRIRWLLQQKD